MNSTDVALAKHIPIFKEEMVWCIVDYMEKEWYSKISPSIKSWYPEIRLYDTTYDTLKWVIYSYMQDMCAESAIFYWPHYMITKYEKAKQWIDLMIYTLVREYDSPMTVDLDNRIEKEKEINNRAKEILKYIVFPYLQR